MRENLRMGVAICEQWVLACEHLTGQVHYGGDHNVEILCTKWFQKSKPLLFFS